MFIPALTKQQRDGVVFYTDQNLKAFGLDVYFTTRKTGFSAYPFTSLNLAFHVKDKAETVVKNWHKVASVFSFKLENTFLAEQVHGNKVKIVTTKTARWPKRIKAVDALITDITSFTLVTLTADCVPVVLVDIRQKKVASIHAGWRGTYSEIVAKSLKRITQAGTKKENIYAYIGPAIGPCCYQVDKERYQLFQAKFNLPAPTTSLDLPALNRELLIRAGLNKKQIYTATICTCCQPDLFYSYRQQAVTGRQAAIVTVREENGV